jgi:hypothetical protein
MPTTIGEWGTYIHQSSARKLPDECAAVGIYIHIHSRDIVFTTLKPKTRSVVFCTYIFLLFSRFPNGFTYVSRSSVRPRQNSVADLTELLYNNYTLAGSVDIVDR